MKNAFKTTWQGCIKMCFLLILLVPVTTGVSASPAPLNYPPPTVSVSGRGPNAIAFTWGAVSGAVSYEVWYVKVSTGNTSAVFNTSNTNFSFSGLPAGEYEFYFTSVFEEKTSDYVIVDDLIIM